MILPAEQLGELVHRLLHDARHGVVERIARLAGLEEDVGVLGRAAQLAAARGSAPAGDGPAPGPSSIIARTSSSVSCSILFTSCEVRKPSKKCRKGTPGLQRGGMGDQGHVLGLLHRADASIAQPVERQAITSL